MPVFTRYYEAKSLGGSGTEDIPVRISALLQRTSQSGAARAARTRRKTVREARIRAGIKILIKSLEKTKRLEKTKTLIKAKMLIKTKRMEKIKKAANIKLMAGIKISRRTKIRIREKINRKTKAEEMADQERKRPGTCIQTERRLEKTAPEQTGKIKNRKAAAAKAGLRTAGQDVAAAPA